MKGTRFTLLKRILPLIGIIIFIYLLFTLNLEKTTQAFLTIPPLYIILALTLTLPVTFLETTLHTLSLYLMMSIGGLLILTLHPELFQIILIWIIIISVLFFIFINKNRGEKIIYFLIRFLVPKQGKYVCTQFVNTFYTDFPRVRTLLVPF